jgi:hypothetical protein
LWQLIDLSDRRKVSRSSIVKVAVMSFLSPDGADRTEAEFTRGLDRLPRQVQRLERDTALGTEALGLFIRLWMAATPSSPSEANGSEGERTVSGVCQHAGRTAQPRIKLLARHSGRCGEDVATVSNTDESNI